MLYNPKWLPETKPDVFSLESLIAWLEKQPVDKSYGYMDPQSCLLGQWLHEVTGQTGPDLGTTSVKFGCQNWTLARIAYPPSGERFVYTFGAALARAKCALATRNGTEA